MTHSPQSIKELLTARLAGSGEVVASTVVAALVDEELNRRKTLILAGLQACDKAEKAIKAIVPDQRQFNGAGVVVSESYSQGKFTELRKAQEAEKKLADAMDKALNANDYGPLAKMLKPNDNAKPTDTPSEG